MPTQTKFICPSGGVNVDFSGIFEELNGGTQYGSATNFKVGSSDINTLFHASTSTDDRPSFNTGYKIGANDLSTIFRRRGFGSPPTITGGSVTTGPYSFTVGANVANFTVTATGSGTLTYAWQFSTNNASWGSVLSTASSYNLGLVSSPNQTGYYRVTVSNAYGSVTATAYMSVVDVAPTITGGTVYNNPTYNFTDGDNNASFTAVATGTNLQYTWSYSADNITFSNTGQSGSMASGDTCQGPQYYPAYIANAGYYRVTISNGAGTAIATALMNVT